MREAPQRTFGNPLKPGEITRAPLLVLTGLTSRVQGNFLCHLLGSFFAAPDFYAKPRAEVFDLETQLKTARDKVAHPYARWHELELLQSVPSP
jgi:hypothetical protein